MKSIRTLVEAELIKFTDIILTDEVFRAAAAEADRDIKFHKLYFGRRTNIKYVTYVLTTAVMLILKVNDHKLTITKEDIQ